MSQQATLGSFDGPKPNREVDASAWDPMLVLTDEGELVKYDPSECMNCGKFISAGIRQLYGVAPGAAMNGCPDCKPKRWRQDGGTVPGREVKGVLEERW